MKASVLVVATPTDGADLAERLRRGGHVLVGVSANVDLAVRRTGDGVAHLLLVDPHLPNCVDGLQLLRQLRERHRCPLAFLVDTLEPALLEATEPYTPLGYLRRPWDDAAVCELAKLAVFRAGQVAATSRREQLVQQAFAQADLGIVVTEITGLVAFMNPAATVLSGWQAADAVGVDYLEVLPTFDPQTRLPKECPAVRVKPGETLPQPGQHLLLRRKDGNYQPVLASLCCLTRSDGRLDGLVFTFRPCDAYHDAANVRSELVAWQARLAAAWDANFAIDGEGRLRQPRGRLAEELQRTAGLAEGAEVLAGLMAPAGAVAELRAVLAGTRNAAEAIVTWQREQQRSPPYRLGLFRDAQAGVVGWIGPVPGTSGDPRQTELDAIQRFAARLGTRSGTQAAALKGAARLVLSQASEARSRPEEIRAGLEELCRTLDCHANFLEELGRFGGQLATAIAPIAPGELLETLRSELTETLGGNGRLQIECAFDAGWIVADEAALRRALLGLVANARDAMPTGGSCQIRVRNQRVGAPHSCPTTYPDLQPGVYTVFEVSDSGVGLAPEIRRRLFEPLHSTRGDARGWGLASLYGLLEQAEGGVEVVTNPGTGTTVRLYWPHRVPIGQDTQQVWIFAEDRQFGRNLGQQLRGRGVATLLFRAPSIMAVRAALLPDRLNLLIVQAGLHLSSLRACVAQVLEAHPHAAVLAFGEHDREVLLLAGAIEGGWNYVRCANLTDLDAILPVAQGLLTAEMAIQSGKTS